MITQKALEHLAEVLFLFLIIKLGYLSIGAFSIIYEETK